MKLRCDGEDFRNEPSRLYWPNLRFEKIWIEQPRHNFVLRRGFGAKDAVDIWVTEAADVREMRYRWCRLRRPLRSLARSGACSTWMGSLVPKARSTETLSTASTSGGLMTHGEHWSALCADIEGLTDSLVPDIITNGTVGYRATAHVAGPAGVVREAEVVEFRQGAGPIRFVAYVAASPAQPNGNWEFVTAFPVCWDGTTRALEIDEARLVDGDVEAVVRARLHAEGGLLWFFDPHHFAQPNRYQPGAQRDFVLAGLAYMLRPASIDTVEVKEGDMLKMHRARVFEKDPTVDPETITSVSISFSEAAFLFPQPDHPENAEFMTTVEHVDDFELLGLRFWRVWATFIRLKEGDPFRLPLYASEAILGDYRPKAGSRRRSHVATGPARK